MIKYIFLICFFNDNFMNNFFYFPVVVTSESLPLLLLQVLSWQQFYHIEKQISMIQMFLRYNLFLILRYIIYRISLK